MPKYSCVIGGCPQKTCNHAVGVEFYRLKYVTDGQFSNEHPFYFGKSIFDQFIDPAKKTWAIPL